MLYEDHTAKLLGLEDVTVKKAWDEEEERHIEIELPRRLHRCPCCGIWAFLLLFGIKHFLHHQAKTAELLLRQHVQDIALLLLFIDSLEKLPALQLPTPQLMAIVAHISISY